MPFTTQQLLTIVEGLITQFSTNQGTIEWGEGSERYRGHSLPELLKEHRRLSSQLAREQSGGGFHLATPFCE